ncbi:MAG: ABC transporter substrate-binding protein [Spirochaetaceae bacterium]
MKRIIVSVLIGVVLISAAFAAGEAEGDAARPTLNVSVPWSGEELDQFRPVVEEFEEQENVNVRYLTYRSEDLSSVLPAQFDANQTLADVIFMWDWWISENAEHAIELSSVWEEFEDAVIPPAITSGGDVYGLPFAMGAKPGFWYRKSFFDEHGLSEPDSWDEFLDLLEEIGSISGVDNPIVTGNGVGWPITDVTEHFLVTFGGPELQQGLIDGDVSWTSSQVRDIFRDRIVPLLEADAFSDPVEWTQAVELWWQGDYGLYFMGNWITGMVDDPGDLGVFSLPDARAIITAPDTFFIPKYSEQQDLAKRFASFLLSEEAQRLRAQSGGKLIVRSDISSSEYPEADQAVAAVVAEMETTVPDLDDTIGGDWQSTFWDQLKLLWVQPDELSDVLERLENAQ